MFILFPCVTPTTNEKCLIFSYKKKPKDDLTSQLSCFFVIGTTLIFFGKRGKGGGGVDR